MGVFAGHVGLGDDGADQHISDVLIGETMIRGPEEVLHQLFKNHLVGKQTFEPF
jgi:hypothetical protein